MVIHAGHARASICLISPTQAMPPYFPFPSSTKATCGPFSVSVVHPVHVRSHFCHNSSIQPVAPFVSDLPRALAHVLANSGNGHPCWPCACLVLSDLTHPGLPFFPSSTRATCDPFLVSIRPSSPCTYSFLLHRPIPPLSDPPCPLRIKFVSSISLNGLPTSAQKCRCLSDPYFKQLMSSSALGPSMGSGGNGVIIKAFTCYP
jgi:hypothetical protein